MLAVLFFWVAGNAAGPRCDYLELYAPGRPRDSIFSDLPVYLAFPDSLGQINVRAYLAATPLKAVEMLKASDWQAVSLGRTDIRFLKGLRNLVEGHFPEVGAEWGQMSGKASSAFKPYLRINRGLLMFMAGFQDDAEKEWQTQTGVSSVCREVARMSLYNSYLTRKNFIKAQAMVDQILAGEPKDRWANFAKGNLVRMSTSDESWEQFLKEKSNSPDSLFEIQIAYGKYLKDQRRYAEAKQYYARGLEGSPRNGPAWLDLAEVYYRLELPFLAQTSLEKSFQAGISDPYVYELLGRVLMDLSNYAADRKTDQDRLWGVLDMHDLQWGLDPAWAERCWKLAEKNLEDGFPHELHSRSMAQLLYHLYCHNGKIEAANNLRSDFWFHFTGPAMPKHYELKHPTLWTGLHLENRSGEFGKLLGSTVSLSDFYEPF